jgi:hypothetical protein
MTAGSGVPLLPAMLFTLFLFSLPAIYLLATDRTTQSPQSHESDVKRAREGDDGRERDEANANDRR